MKKQPASINKELNQLKEYRDKICIFCGRVFPRTILNIEGHIHHGLSYQCVDLEDCKKNRKANGLKPNVTK